MLKELSLCQKSQYMTLPCLSGLMKVDVIVVTPPGSMATASQSVIIAYWSEEKGTQPSLLFRWKGFMTCSLPKALWMVNDSQNLLRMTYYPTCYHSMGLIRGRYTSCRSSDRSCWKSGRGKIIVSPTLLTRLESSGRNIQSSEKHPESKWQIVSSFFSTKNTAINCFHSNYRRELFKPHIKQWLHLACSTKYNLLTFNNILQFISV